MNVDEPGRLMTVKLTQEYLDAIHQHFTVEAGVALTLPEQIGWAA